MWRRSWRTDSGRIQGYDEKIINEINQKVGYDVLVCSNDQIIPIDNLMENEAQKIVIFDDFVCEKKSETID